MSKFSLEKEEELEIKLPTFTGLYRKYWNFRKTFLFTLGVDHDKRWKALKEVGIPDHLTCLMRNL